MTLIKKTVVLVKEKTKGYITIIKLGETVGAKVVLNEASRETLWLALKIGNNPQTTHSFSGAGAEFSLDIPITPTDSIGAAIMDATGAVYAYGGRRDTISLAALKLDIDADIAKDLAKTTDAQQISDKDKTNTAKPLKDELAKQPKQGQKLEKQLAQETVSQEQADNKQPKNSSPFASKDIPNIDNDDPEVEILPQGSSKRNPFDVPKGENFYQAVRSRLNDIMTINPREERLERLIPDSQWVRVKYDGDDYYVVGILTDEGVPTHIAYGVPGRKDIKPPKEAEELCDFLPINDPNEGFWLMFQNAQDGTMIKN
ncbi:MAG: hypothetical protein WC292_07080 [Clostridia bacterium]